MFKYFWIAVLAISYLIWGVFSVKNIIELIKNVDTLEDLLCDMEDYTIRFFVLTFAGLMIGSFVMWGLSILQSQG